PGCGGRRRRSVNPARRPTSRRSDGDRLSARRGCLIVRHKLMDQSTAYGVPWRGADVARAAEAAGVTAFCCGGFVAHAACSTFAEMALYTQRAKVGPGIAYAFARTPYAHAAGIRGAWRHAPGRVFLGLGSGAFRINRDWFGVAADRPVERMAD